MLLSCGAVSNSLRFNHHLLLNLNLLLFTLLHHDLNLLWLGAHHLVSDEEADEEAASSNDCTCNGTAATSAIRGAHGGVTLANLVFVVVGISTCLWDIRPVVVNWGCEVLHYGCYFPRGTVVVNVVQVQEDVSRALLVVRIIGGGNFFLVCGVVVLATIASIVDIIACSEL